MFEAGRIADASAELDAALRLWQGPVLADLADYEFANSSARLDEVRLAALDTRSRPTSFSAARRPGRGAGRAHAAHPVRERCTRSACWRSTGADAKPTRWPDTTVA